MWLTRRRRILAFLALAAAIIGTLAWLASKSEPSRPKNPAASPAVDPPASSAPPPAPVVATHTTGPSRQAAPPFPPSELLLKAKAGTFAAQAAFDAVAAFAKRTPEALAELDRLAASTDPIERLLALHLRLELNGPTPEILDAASNDPSPWVSAQAAEWLFFHSRFDLWKTYVADTGLAWNSAKTSELIERLATTPGTSPELPAGLVILQLGRGLPDLVGALLESTPFVRASMETALFDLSTPPEARTALLDIFHDARPPGYIELLQRLIVSHSEDSPARFRAFTHYIESADTTDAANWLASQSPPTIPPDPLAFRFVDANRVLSEKSIATASAPSLAMTRTRLTQALSDVKSITALPENERRALRLYLQQLQKTPPTLLDAPLLERLGALMGAEPFRDYSARRTAAEINYLAAQARK